jgi:hypothetical protein
MDVHLQGGAAPVRRYLPELISSFGTKELTWKNLKSDASSWADAPSCSRHVCDR